MNVENFGSNDDAHANHVTHKPTPDKFNLFLPWACKELQIDVEVFITTVQNKISLTPSKNTSKKHNKSTQASSQHVKVDKENENSKQNKQTQYDDNDLFITAVYDAVDNDLTKLIFTKNKSVPRQVFRVIALTLPYNTKLTSITASKCVNAPFIYELNKILKLSNITDICLDSTSYYNQCYDILLENETHLTNLSLARCLIDDSAVEKIASKLLDKLPASRTLALLNLASNGITDVGAKHLANALMTNRHLLYLNLAGNALTDAGAIAILDVLSEFEIPKQELYLAKKEMMVGLKEKIEKRRIQERIAENKRAVTRKMSRSANVALKKKAADSSTKVKEVINEEECTGPFSSKNVFAKDGVLFCYGNNRLANLNLSFNDITYFTVKKLLAVVRYQQMKDRQPRGLVTVSIEGSSIPDACTELGAIDLILQGYLATKRPSTPKKKAPKFTT